jgi:RNA polymerase-binding transcription factor DksA
MINETKLSELKSALLKERDLLTGELETIATPDPNLKDDWNVKHQEWGEDQITSQEELETGESANESDEDMKNKALSDDLELKLRDVNDALDRIEGGTYGICETCGKEIPLDRLEANPSAKTDIEHAK